MRERLESQGLSTEGTKPVLLARLRDSQSGAVAQTPGTPSGVETPGRRSKRLSESGPGEVRPGTPVKRGRVSDSSRPATPVRRSRRLSGDLLEAPVLSSVAPDSVAVETIAEVTEEEEQEGCVETPETVDKQEETVEHKSSEIDQKLDLVKNIIKEAKEEISAEKREETRSKEEKKDDTEGKENVPMPKLLDQIFSSKQIPRQKPKSGRFWKGERSQFRQIKKDKGQRHTFEQRLKMKEERQRNKEVAEMLIQRKNQAKEELRKKMEENKTKRLENERKTEQYQIIKNPAKLKRMKKKQLRMLEKRDILASKKN